MATLAQHKHFAPLPRDSRLVMAQIGWIGASGNVYALDRGPTATQEPGSFSPIYIALGVWEDLGDGHYGIKD